MSVDRIKNIILSYIDKYEEEFLTSYVSDRASFCIDFLLNSMGAAFDGGKIILAHQDPPSFFAYYKNLVKTIPDKDFVSVLFMLVHKSQKVSLYQLIQRFLTKTQRGQLLRDCWVSAEFPSLYSLQNGFDFINELKKVGSEHVMEKSEIKKLKDLPDTVVCYRGVYNEAFKDGASYSLSIDKARWFAKRFRASNQSDIIFLSINGVSCDLPYQGLVYKLECSKQSVLVYFQREDEVVVDTTLQDIVPEVLEIL